MVSSDWSDWSDLSDPTDQSASSAREMIEAIREERLRLDAYTLLGSDPDTNVEYAAYAQAEVMRIEEAD